MIRAFELNGYAYCPRSVYLKSVLGLEAPMTERQMMGVVGHAVWLELYSRLGKLLSGLDSVEEAGIIMSLEVDSILISLPALLGSQWLDGMAAILPRLRFEFAAETDNLVRELDAMVCDMGFKGALEYVTPWRVGYELRSEGLSLSGRVDKVFHRKTMEPADIKAAADVEFGWEGDRVQLCAYGMLLEEEFKETVPHGFLEYPRVQRRVPVLFLEELRSDVFEARDGVQEIFGGCVPDVCPHGQPGKCEGCGLKEQCYSI